jgi:transcription elongation GreA/GreB family factor
MEGDRQKREGGGMAAAPTPTPARVDQENLGDLYANEHTAELLAALKHGEIDEARVAQVAALIEVASALEDVVTAKGGAGLGSIVTVADRAGQTSEYELIARPSAEAAREKVPLSSRVGRTLLGAKKGDYVHVTRPNGSQRRVQVTDVKPGAGTSLRAALEDSAAAA